MRTFEYTITDPVGIHARPAGALAKVAKVFVSKTVIFTGEKSAEATRLMSVMGLCIGRGDRIRVEITGEDEDRAAEEIERFFRERL